MPQPVTLIHRGDVMTQDQHGITDQRAYLRYHDDDTHHGNVIYDADDYTYEQAVDAARCWATDQGYDGFPVWIALWPTGTGNHAAHPVTIQPASLGMPSATDR